MTRTKVLDTLLVLGGMSSLGLGVLAARAIADGQGPSRAKAAPTTIDLVEPVSPRYEHAPAPGTDVLMAEVAKRSIAGEFSTIFYAPKAPAPAVPNDPKRPEVKDAKLALSSIMAGREPMAIIDGKLLRTGARVGDRWTIKQINPEAGSVTLESLDGETQELRLRR
ncbi:MAG: hypothetical protein IT432_12875 [Phycisphaerales bacterium]|nr:hypothetical protein [Phycisphaerales bacterium]